MSTDLDLLLQAYLDGTLSPARRAAVDKRLGDPKVARRLERLRGLRGLLSAAAPQPSPEQSRRMWSAIRAQVRPAAPARPSLWESVSDFFTRPWLRGTLGLGLAGAAAAVVFLILRPGAPVPMAMDSVQPAPAPAAAEAAAPAAAPQPEAAARREAPASQVADAAVRRAADEAAAGSEDRSPAPPASAAAPVLAKAAAHEPTEVERALAENTVDDLIDNFLRQGAGSGTGTATRSLAALGGGRGGAQSVAAVGAFESTPDPDAHFDSKAAQAAQGGPDRNGFWDWRPAALALNRHDWRQAQLELSTAEGRAREASERAFAASALSLLAAPGAPLQGTQPALPATGDLRVLGAGRWQLLVDSRLARFSQGVSARLPGFRAEGDSLLLDLTFDRGSFAPGTRFTRVAGEDAAQVFDAAARPVSADEILAPAGADYHVDGHELHLR